MRKKILAAALSILAVSASAFALTACGGNKYTYELVSVTLSDSEYNHDWVYIDNDAVEEIVNYPAELRYVFDVTLKRSDGNTVDGTLDLRYYAGMPQNFVSSVEIGDSYYADNMLQVEIGGFDASEIAYGKELSIKLAAGASDSKIKSGECETTVDYSVVHAVKNHTMSYPAMEFQLNDELDLSAITFDFEYEDGTTEMVGLDEILTLPQMKGSAVTGFDSSSYGHKTLNITVSYNDGERTSSDAIYYNINPDPEVWTKKNGSGGYYVYHTTEDMTVTSLQQNGTRFTKVAFGDAKLLMLYGTGILFNVEASDFQDMLNYTSQGNNLLHCFMPTGERATVTKMDKKPVYKIYYYNTDGGNNKTSENILYVVYEGRTGKILAINLADVDTLSQEELSTADMFATLAWF